jgi:hypothetical protein
VVHRKNGPSPSGEPALASGFAGPAHLQHSTQTTKDSARYVRSALVTAYNGKRREPTAFRPVSDYNGKYQVSFFPAPVGEDR